jgi:tRNA(Ile)-lysidine synthase
VSKYLSPPDDLLAISDSLLALCPVANWHERALALLNDTSCDSIGVACSGGADSTFALLLAFAAFPSQRGKMVVLHYNHKLRENSDKDERFVVELANKLKLPHEGGKAVGLSKGDEGTLRNQRLDYIFKVCRQKHIDRIIQGHNQDDVAETILWRLSRGSSPQGLCAPRPVHQHGDISLIRPFITIDRSRIREMLSRLKMPWREDESNDSPKYLRNRIRMNSLSMLKEDVDRDLLQGMTRSRDLLEEQEDAIREWASEASENCLGNGSLDIERLAKYPKAIKRRVIYDWLKCDHGIKEISSCHLEKIIKSLENEGSLGVSLSSLVSVRLVDSRLVLENAPSKKLDWSLTKLPFGQRLHLPNGKSLSFTTKKASPSLISQIVEGKVSQKAEAYCSCEHNEKTLFVRTRLPGDQYRPIGSPGRKKLTDWMIDRKFDQSTKDSTPVILNFSGEIIWVPGFAPAETRRVNDSDEQVIHLTCR